MASTPSSSVEKSFKYDVFLSFRGEDTRKTFVSHLHKALVNEGITTYKDDETIEKEKGERIDDQLIRSIEESRSYIIVFSKNYANSSCGAHPSPESKHVEKEAAGKWREALTEAGKLAGWEFNTFDGDEAQFIQKIVEDISLKLHSNHFGIDENLVGMQTRVYEIVSSLEIDISDVRMIGIKGMGGSGKTTLASAVYKDLSIYFEGKCFVENVRGSSLKDMQKQILSDVLNDPKVDVKSVFEGKSMMKSRISFKKVLIVLCWINLDGSVYGLGQYLVNESFV
ncbi:hypothetical protein R6Q59_016401 [Mikania micrantha]